MRPIAITTEQASRYAQARQHADVAAKAPARSGEAASIRQAHATMAEVVAEVVKANGIPITLALRALGDVDVPTGTRVLTPPEVDAWLQGGLMGLTDARETEVGVLVPLDTTYRPLSAEETEAYLAGQAVYVGARETEEGVEVPVTWVPVRLAGGDVHVAQRHLVSTTILGSTPTRCGATLYGAATLDCPPQIGVCPVCVPTAWWATSRTFATPKGANNEAQRQYEPTEALLWRIAPTSQGWAVQVADVSHWAAHEPTHRCTACGMLTHTDDLTVIGRYCPASDFEQAHDMQALA